MASIKCGHCTQTHYSVQEVRDCSARKTPKQMAVLVTLPDPALPGMTWTRAKREAEESGQDVDTLVAEKAAALGVKPENEGAASTPKQRNFIAILRAERGMDALEFTGTMKQASAEINRLKTIPKAAAPKATAKAEPADGIYITANETVYKVYKMVHGSGRQGVKILHINEGEKSGKFVYLGQAARHLPGSARRMTLEEAKKFGAMYGFCVRCGATLTDETSIANGIGPICAGRDW